ncbi:hypothetical protein CTY75_24225, partial [Acinetobacter baumannii]|jgi:hypothetical protein
MLG